MQNATKPANDVTPLNPITLLVLAFIIGVVAGFGAIGFRILISLFHNLLFFGVINTAYDANQHTPLSPWGIGVILVPVVGSLGVSWLVSTFAPEAKGHGVPEVIDAIYYKQGKIRPLVALVKSFASALSIGSGGSVGREGPIIQIGSAFGSTLGQWVKMPQRQRIILLSAGAGAGIAATFNAPIGGVAFAVELLLVTINAASISAVAVATITAAYIGRLFLGVVPAFDIPMLAALDLHVSHISEMIVFIPFGITVGVVAAIFTHSIYWFEDLFDAIPTNYYLRHLLGMSLMGIMMYLFGKFTGHYYVQGVGYATIFDILIKTLTNPWFLTLLCVAKLVATGLTIGSGASGGVFSPSLYLGATLGAAFCNFLQILFPHFATNQIVFAVAGMAGMVGGGTGAVMTAITMMFEMTRDYNAILPIILTVAIAYVTRKLISPESIYTLKLIRRGRAVHEGLQAARLSGQRARHLMNKSFVVVKHSELDMPELGKTTHSITIVEESGQIVGLVTTAMSRQDIAKYLKKDFLIVTPETEVVEVLRAMQHGEVDTAVVSSQKDSVETRYIQGVISANEILELVASESVLMH